ncbi:hypothetical protein A3D85_00355 [Candidatus Amesbacteria bacterium RIFCSPHIGHO2_02_FULL_47_9]|uniref:R3H domain-containing protein n=1 Tax=Candidatus Amesbacteria bacterium RIFCSPHIGHO2_01_FULL_48_32b TaxID=1797253 RepID=A0A1F4YGI3_9BACT|nr:MAG: hypothetical protein A2876_01060 [Candidatus Amesbacteria bacterium RIFCSPHIGHO2_01_FULL_48_32b]OGD03530.1 MAG: hypothetical protein A3D85_00355 [Candidatus Amesbacteria bacterium RIFCSPHIGHO2_02_FULL_47_9]OGD07394.1 MAG: hypothetical protein A2899_03770 [Candidatus Amesbacteria bacterium RIFCSPLOWO2_01_FULL_49_25]
MDHTQTLSDLTQDLLTHTGFGSEVEIQARYDPNENIYQVSLQTPSPAVLIGYHGETLSALQFILGQHVHTKTGEWLNLSVNINDYKERREQSLKALADSVVNQTLTTGIPHALPPLPASERRIVHLYLADHPQVTTSSQGIGRSRSVVISPKA